MAQRESVLSSLDEFVTLKGSVDIVALYPPLVWEMVENKGGG